MTDPGPPPAGDPDPGPSGTAPNWPPPPSAAPGAPAGGAPWPPPGSAPNWPPPGNPGPPGPAPSWPPPGGDPYPPGEGFNPFHPAGPPPEGPGPAAPTRSGLGPAQIGLLLALGLVVVGWLVHEGKITTPEVVLFCCLIPSIILHEIAHGWVALAFGDDTAKRAGRLSLNPLRHIDPVGTLLVPALMSLSGYGFFGWAKPVPVNVGRLRSPRNQGVLVSLAGPGTNAVLAGLAAAAFFAVGGVGSFAQAFTLRGNVSHVNVAYVLYYLGLVNLGLGAFNLIPIPPLDGSVLVERLLPRAWWPGYLRIRPFTMPILLVLVVINLQLGTHGPITWLFDQLNAWWNHVLLGI